MVMAHLAHLADHVHQALPADLLLRLLPVLPLDREVQAVL